ncbi:methylsterol monooxygenase-like [Leptopilina heterotoma]|uniref:methylsterol monooxygenase-like n=1 Tax=Leptopilina heterotoma TaxID=63436 RepID=UPI001CA7F44D|nr:methylsterol monooxygenase-like [Leptopilina heterotoma]
MTKAKEVPSETRLNSKKIENELNIKSEAKGGSFFDPMSVTWMEKYNYKVEKIWSTFPSLVQTSIVTCAIFLLGSFLRGEWMLILIHFVKHFGYGENVSNSSNASSFPMNWRELSMESFYLKNLFYFWVPAMTISCSMYYGIGGFIHWYFYVRQRDKPEEWKCQPQKFLSPELERHEIMLGSFSLLCTSSVSALLACYMFNGGPCFVYYPFNQYGWFWWFLQWPIVFIYMDYLMYWIHRTYHTPWLYKNFHKLHHKYKQPTAFSVTAIHPVEILHIQVSMFLPLFFCPLHWVPYCVISMYNYYHGIIDHSGVNFKAFWWQPWQPDAIFHDNHHQYFHVNFGFNCSIWDKIHGTFRLKDRIYTEKTFYGIGKKIEEATEKELLDDIAEREAENPLAYRDNNPIYRLSRDDLKLKKIK